MKRFLLFLVLSLITLCALAANVGDWTYYLSYHNATQAIPAGRNIYILYDGNLQIYDRETQEVQALTKVDGLSSQHISYMGYSHTARCLVLVYSDKNIDLRFEDGTVVNMPQFKNSNIPDLTINNLSISDNNAILALNNGVAHIDIKRQELRGYYPLSQQITEATISSGRFYAATVDKKILTTSANGNPTDPANWTIFWEDTYAPELFTSFANGLYFSLRGGDRCGLWRVESDPDGNNITRKRLTPQPFLTASVSQNEVIFCNGSYIYIYNGETPQEATIIKNPTMGLSRSTDGTFWVANGMEGLVGYTLDGETFTPNGVRVGGDGPLRDLCYYMTFAGERLLVAGGKLDVSDRQHFSGTIMKRENGEWSAFQDKGFDPPTHLPYMDITCIIQHPADSSLHYASAGGSGLYEFRGGRYVKNFNTENSPLRSAAKNGHRNYVRVDGLNFDKEGNLWMVNNGVDSTLCIFKADGTWSRLSIETIRRAPALEKTLFDSKGRLWVASRLSEVNVHGAGLLCLDYNGTIDNTDDDVATYRTEFYNQDGTDYTFWDGVYDIMEDSDGSIWIGAQCGLFVISNPDTWSSPDFRMTQIKVPRNDGTNFADYLLDDIRISALAVDGAGRKWIGTLYNGLYLVSPDGTEILHHFQADSSPLLSDVIYDIAIDESTGEVFIGTDVGICSYQSDATSPTETLKENNVKVYPNPVRPEYSGNITLTGLTVDADIKVTTATGQVVAAGTSSGGSFIWDGRSASGERVATGIYYFMIADAQGNEGVVAKVAIVR